MQKFSEYTKQQDRFTTYKRQKDFKYRHRLKVMNGKRPL